MHRLIHPLAAAVLSCALGGDTAAQCVPGDLDGNGIVDGGDLGLLLLQWGEDCPPPTVVSVVPAVGPLAGGIPIAIKGGGLDGILSVTIGGEVAEHVVGVDSTTVARLPSNQTA